MVVSTSERGTGKLGDSVEGNLFILYILPIIEFYTVYMHFILKKVKLQNAGVEIFNSQQNRIQYEKHYETKANF